MNIIVTGLRGFPNIQGGVETHCEELFPRIAQQGMEVTVVRRSCFVDENPIRTQYNGVYFKDFNSPKIKGLEAALHTLRAVFYAAWKRPDILHIHAIGPSIVVPIAKLFGLRVVVTHHGPDYDRQRWGKFAKFVLKLGERFAAGYADDIIVISTVIQDILKTKYSRTRNVHLIYNGVNIPEKSMQVDYLTSLNVEPGKYILAVGRFVEEKNFDQLIEAYKRINLSYPVKLVIAGDADIETPYSIALKELAQQDGVVLTGMIKGEKLKQLYSHAALFVLPSSHEGLPITLLEAMSYDRKVVVSDIPANLAVNLDNNCYFKLDNQDDLIRKIELQLSDKAPSKKYDLSNYNWNHIAVMTAAVYSSETK